MLTIESVKNIKWVSPDHSSFECIVKYAEFDEEMPVGVVPGDLYKHIQELWNNGVSGVYGPIEEYVEPPIPPLTQGQIARRAAKAVLANPDSTEAAKKTAENILATVKPF